MTEEKRGIGDVIQSLEKLYGSSTNIWRGDDERLKLENNGAISTGSILLDYEISPTLLGIPRGRILEMVGREGSGKSFLSFLCCREYLNSNPDGFCVIIDAEHVLDIGWLEKLKIPLDRVIIFQESSSRVIEEILIGVNSDKPGNSKKKPGLLDMQLSEERGSELGIIVLDSLASVITDQQEVTSSDRSSMSTVLSRWLTPFAKKISPMLSRSKVTFIGINQLREDINAYSPTGMTIEKSPGGRSYKHHSSLLLHMKSIGGKDGQVIDSKTNEIVGVKTKIVIKKNKMNYGKDKVIELEFDFTKGIANKEKEIIEVLLRQGQIGRPSNVMYEFDGQSFRGKERLQEYFASKSEEELNGLIEQIKEKAKGE